MTLPPRTVRVLISERRALYAAALHTLLSLERDMQVVATLMSDVDVAAAANRTRADIALVDIDSSLVDPSGLCLPLRRGAPTCRIIALTEHYLPEPQVRSWAAHADGLVSKHSVSSVLVESIRRVMTGEVVVDPRFASATMTRDNATLTLRELDLLRHAAHGHSVKELAARLSLSDGTVRNYLSRINAKLGARNRIEAIRIGRDSGWL
ncbi:MAG: response regulator transcription factor [Sporichthyaceae bacterium]